MSRTLGILKRAAIWSHNHGFLPDSQVKFLFAKIKRLRDA